jgi:hypothetical protein
MSDPKKQTEAPEALRGEAAWKEEKERVAKRNAEAQRAGKENREAYEQNRDALRRGAEGREMARFMAKKDTP